MKSHTSSLFAALCLATLPALPANATSEPWSPPGCSTDLDCAPDETCVLVTPSICWLDEEGECAPPDESEATGFCEQLALDPSCFSDADCAAGFYCEMSGATCGVFCDEDENCEVQCDDTPEPEGRCVEAFVGELTECFEDSDCDSGESCQHVAYEMEDDSASPSPNAPGICGPNWEELACTSDADCGEGAHCEILFYPGCVEPAADGPDDAFGHPCEEAELQGICVEDGFDPNGGHCRDDPDCEPGFSCNADLGGCEDVEYGDVEPALPDTCVTDEDCGEGAVCMAYDYEPNCPPLPIVECPRHILSDFGYCEYRDAPSAEEKCIIALYDECLVYGGENQDLNCDATSGAPTWLAFLAVLGLVQRRKSQR